MSLKAQLTLVIGAALAFCVVIGFVTFEVDRTFVSKTTFEFQESQLEAVNQVAERVRWQFQKLNDALYSLSQVPQVQFIEENEALLHLIRAYRMNQSLVEGIFRLDRTGLVRLTYPSNAVSPSLEELHPILERARLTGDSVHQVIHRQGDASDVLVLAKPVYTIQGEVRLHPNNKFVGLLLFTISLGRLNRNILDLPSFGRSGFFWVMTDKGVMVGAERGTLLGRPVAEVTLSFPKIARDGFLHIVERMRHGASGNDRYLHPLGPHLPDLIINEYSQSLPLGQAPHTSDVIMPHEWQTRLVAFAPLILGNDRWSIGVVSPKDDVTLLIDQAIGDRWLITAAFVVTMIAMTGLIVIIIRRNNYARIREMERTAQQLRESETRLANAQRTAKVGHWEWDSREKTAVISDSLYRILELPCGETRFAYKDFFRMLHPDDKKEIRRAIFQALKTRTGCKFEHRIIRQDGTNGFVHQEVEVQSDENGRISKIIGIAQDVTERWSAEEKIRSLAYFDSVTGLPNRTFLKELMSRSIENARRYQRILAVLFLDLDNFKCINDTLGHDAGDTLLREVSGRLAACVRSSDYTSHAVPELEGRASSNGSTVTRLGGDEFVIVLTELLCTDNAAQVAHRVAKALSVPVIVAGNEITVSASIGIAVFPGDGDDTETLLKNADAAMYHAKSQGRNGYTFYTKPLHDQALKRLSLEANLRKALKHEAFVLYLQPRLNLRQQRIDGAEALLRWQHPQDGLVLPREFIPVAEETGLILPIGEWVLREACKQAATWQGADPLDLRVSVNLSAVQFKQRGFVKRLEAILRETDLKPQCLELELTESLLIENTKANAVILRELTDLGISVSVDDFGTGYSSLSYLKQFPLTALKIDQSFVRDIPDDPDDLAIVNATIALAHSLRLRAIAEGVEKRAQLDFLKAAGCDEVQGYLIGHPMPTDEFKDWMSEHRSEHSWTAARSGRSGTKDNNVVVLSYGRFGKADQIG